MSKFYRVLVGVAVILGNWSSYGQTRDLSILAKILPKLESTFTSFTNPGSSFSAKLEFDTVPVDGRPPFHLPAKVYFANGNLCCEIDVEQQSNGTGRAQAHSTNPVLMFKQSEQKLLVIESDKQTFHAVKMAPSALAAFAAERQVKVRTTPVGTETVNGKALVKAKGNVMKSGQQGAETTVWYDESLNHFPMKIETVSTNEVTTITFSQVQMKPISADKFLVPAGYTKETKGKKALH